MVYSNQDMITLKTDVVKLTASRAAPKEQFATHPIIARYEYTVSKILDMDRRVVLDNSAARAKVPNMDMCGLCSDITETLGKETRGGIFGLSMKAYVYFFKKASVAVRICTGAGSEDAPYCTVSIHHITDEKQLDELKLSGWNLTSPKKGKTGTLEAIRHPGHNTDEDSNVETVYMCMERMFQDAEFTKKFLEAKIACAHSG